MNWSQARYVRLVLLTLWERLDDRLAQHLPPAGYRRLYEWPRWERAAKAWTTREIIRLNAELSPRSLVSY